MDLTEVELPADMLFRWHSGKRGRKLHLCHSDGSTFCKAENGSYNLDVTAFEPEPGRRLCHNCLHVLDRPNFRRR